MGLRHMFFNVCRRAKQGSPTFLSILAVGGVVVTAVLAVKGTPKAKQRIGIAEMNKGEPLTTPEMVIAAAPAYIPSALAGVATVSCILGANVLNKKQQVALASAYMVTDQYLKNYRSTLIKLHGKEADEEVRAEMVREYCDYHVTGVDYPDEKVTFYDEISGRTFGRKKA